MKVVVSCSGLSIILKKADNWLIIYVFTFIYLVIYSSLIFIY